MTSNTRIPKAEPTGVYGSVVKWMSRTMVGGIATAVRKPLVGAERVAKFLARAATMPDFAATTAWYNGMLGLRFDVGGEVTALSLAVDGARITRVYAVRNPHKLGSLASTAQLRR